MQKYEASEMVMQLQVWLCETVVRQLKCKGQYYKNHHLTIMLERRMKIRLLFEQ